MPAYPPKTTVTRRDLLKLGTSAGLGAIFAPVACAVDNPKEDEIYVRAKITASKPKANGSVAGEFECAWTQPLVNPNR